MSHNQKPLYVPGVGHFPSQNAAQRELGIGYQALMRRVESGYYLPENIAQRERAARGIPTRDYHYTVGTFATFVDRDTAIDFLGVSRSVFEGRLERGDYGDPKREEYIMINNAINKLFPSLMAIRDGVSHAPI